jgi:predicted nucleic acid-binding protein
MFKRNRLDLDEAKRGLEIFKSIPIRYIDPDFANAVSISKQSDMYAYDAYFLDCALRKKAPILTLDSRLKKTAQHLKISILEV